jgi:hypothetical protein
MAGGVSATEQRRHGVRYGAARVERDVLIATIDVCDEEWKQAAAAHAAHVVGREALGRVTDAWSPDLCCELAAIADIIQRPSELARHMVEWFVASIAMAHGIPPFIARVLGRLVANWLFAPDDLDTTAERVRVLGVLLCVMNGDLDRCPCLAELGEAVAVDALEDKLREGLNVSPEPGEPTAVRVEPMRFATVTQDARVSSERLGATRFAPEAAARPERSHGAERSVSQPGERDRAAGPAGEAGPGSGPRPGPGPGPGPGPEPGPGPGPGPEPGPGPGPGPGPEPGPGPGPGPTPPHGPEPGSGPLPGDEPDEGTERRPVPRPGRPPGSGPAGAGADEADPRLIAACDQVRGARYVPPPATFGAAAGPR